MFPSSSLLNYANHQSGSTATIVRIPFIHQLTENEDFLYNNVDVSIWSTVEPGIGITASAMATLRPLFMTFFSRSRLLGSSTNEAASGWGNSKPNGNSRRGYFRSERGNENGLELGLSGLPKGSGVSTTIRSMNDISGSQAKEEKINAGAGEDSVVEETVKRIQRFGNARGNGSLSTKALKGHDSTWNSSQSRLTEDSSSEEGVVVGDEGKKIHVRKTTQVSVAREWKEGHGPVGVAMSRPD